MAAKRVFGTFPQAIIPEANRYFTGKIVEIPGGHITGLRFEKPEGNTRNIIFRGVYHADNDGSEHEFAATGPMRFFYDYGVEEKGNRKYQVTDISEFGDAVKIIMSSASGEGFKIEIQGDDPAPAAPAEEVAAAPMVESDADEGEVDADDASTEPDVGYQSTPEHKQKKKTKKQKIKVSKKKLRQLYQDAHVQQGNMGVQLTNPVFDQSSKHLKLVGLIYDIADDGTFSFNDKVEIIGETSDLNPADPDYVDKVRELTKKIIAKYRERKLSNPATEAEKRGAQLSRRIPVASRRAIMKKIREFHP